MMQRFTWKCGPSLLQLLSSGLAWHPQQLKLFIGCSRPTPAFPVCPRGVPGTLLCPSSWFSGKSLELLPWMLRALLSSCQGWPLLPQGHVLHNLCITYSMKSLSAPFFVFWSAAVNGTKLFLFFYFYFTYQDFFS